MWDYLEKNKLGRVDMGFEEAGYKREICSATVFRQLRVGPAYITFVLLGARISRMSQHRAQQPIQQALRMIE